MKILHTADWHLGKRLENVPRFEEQVQVMQEICDIADRENVDAVVVAGDLFDNFNPSAEATELLYSTLHKLTANGSRAVIAIAGNHDSPERIEVPDVLARLSGITFVGFPNALVKPFATEGGVRVLQSANGFVEFSLPRCSFPLRVLHTPYANETRLRTFLGETGQEQALRDHLAAHWQTLADSHCNAHGFNLLTAHLYVMKNGGEAPEEPEDERPIVHIGGAQAIFSENFPKQIQYVALGHLHRYQVIDTNPCPVVYSSSPLCYSFSEANQKKYVVLLQAAPGELVSYSKIELSSGKPLLTKRCHGLPEALEWLQANPEALVQLTYVSDKFLEASDNKRLHDCHSGIIKIIPEISEIQLAQADLKRRADLSQRTEEIFAAYFEYKKGQKPSEEIMSLFAEMMAEPD